MSYRDLDQRAIVRLLRSAATVEPAAAEHSALVARVRAATFEISAPPSVRRGRWRTAIGVAAAVGALLLAIGAIFLATRPRTAWAQLEAAAQASAEFRGWVGVRADAPGARPFVFFDTERLSRAYVGPPDAKGRMPVRLLDHRRATDFYWSPAAGCLFVSDLSPAEMEMTYERYAKKFNQAVDFNEQLKNMREAVGAGNLDVRSERDGPFDRFDIDWFRRDASGRREPTPVDAMSYWVDPKTHLIAKVRHARRGEKPVTQVYEYNDPVVNDIYDLGVPRDAKVVDRRPTGVLKNRLDALDRWIEAGTGDGVAIVTTVTAQQDPGGGKGPALDTLEIYGRSGDRWVWAQYLVGRGPGRDAAGNARQRPQLAAPSGWPNLAPAAAVALVKNLRPDDLFVHAGDRSYRSFKGRMTEAKPASRGDAAYFGLPGLFWPGRFRLRLYEPQSAPSLRHEANGDETIGVDQIDMDSMKRYASHEVTLSKQTGLPVAAASRIFDAADVERLTDRWTFVSNLQTRAGIVLPERWTYEGSAAPGRRSIRKESTLRFDSNLRVPESWFESPVKRFGERSPKP
ncbi:MAG TPA: hypothetical protein VGI81_25255 [Tepidisphaeraceae bacterium]